MIPGGGSIKEYKEVNARESLELADAFLSYNFLNVMPHKKATNPFYRGAYLWLAIKHRAPMYGGAYLP